MTYRTVHENNRIDARTLLSTLWIAVLLADLFRAVHETVRPGFVEELADAGTAYGNEVTNSTLAISGFMLCFLTATVVLTRILPRRSNRRLNLVAAALTAGGLLAIWPKDPDDYVFGAFMLATLGVIVTVCARWRTDDPPNEPTRTDEAFLTA